MRRSGTVYLVAAAALFGLSVQAGASTSVLVIVATALLAVSAMPTSRSHIDENPVNWNGLLLLWIVVFAVLGVVGWRTSAFGPTSQALERLPGLVWLILGALIYATRDRMTNALRIGLVATVVITTAVIGLAHLDAARGTGIDVYFLHVQAAEALANFENPYTDVVEVPNGSPTAEPGDTIIGYVYPPVTAAAYSLGYWAFDDPRYTSLLAWLAILTTLGVASIRRRSTPGLLMVVVLASIPGWPYVLRAAWTEPLSLALLFGAYMAWRRPTGSGAFLGFAFASKQYFAVAAPLLLLMRGKGWIRRTITAFIVIAITIGAALLWDFTAFWESAVSFHTSTPPRPDSVNLVGLMALFDVVWDPPTFLAIAVGLGVAILAGRNVNSSNRFFLVLALVLASSFMVSSQAFANYWFLVFGLCTVVIWERASSDSLVVES